MVKGRRKSRSKSSGDFSNTDDSDEVGSWRRTNIAGEVPFYCAVNLQTFRPSYMRIFLFCFFVNQQSSELETTEWNPFYLSRACMRAA
jgi:hypothetical protein